MRRHIIIAFERVNETWITIDDKICHINLKVPLHIRVGIFANNKRSAGMVAEHLTKADIDFAGIEQCGVFAGLFLR